VVGLATLGAADKHRCAVLQNPALTSVVSFGITHGVTIFAADSIDGSSPDA
jgi:hypothetical protein